MKTLDDAIGCWTIRKEGLPRLSWLVGQSMRWCRIATRENDPYRLTNELDLLETRLETMLSLTRHAQVRLVEIINTKELEKVNV